MQISNKTTIIWDWNGTLLNDAELCVECMNKVLSKRNMQQIDVNDYRKLFTFPVVDYYNAIGFDFSKEDFEVPAMEFINQYYSNIGRADLFPCVTDVLNFFKKLGFKQLVLSAMEHDNLVNSLTEKGIFDFFDDISGINDHYAHSKLEMGRGLIKKADINVTETLMIGDTVHDFEVASGLEVDCVLVSNGHQSEHRLLQATANVIPKLIDITTLFSSNNS